MDLSSESLNCVAGVIKTIVESQPFIGNIPAGNVLTSASILCSGAFLLKALYIFLL